MSASMEELSLCPGIGEKKVRRLYNAFHQPFKANKTKQAKIDGVLKSSSQPDPNNNSNVKNVENGKEEERLTFDTSKKRTLVVESDDEEDEQNEEDTI